MFNLIVKRDMKKLVLILMIVPVLIWGASCGKAKNTPDCDCSQFITCGTAGKLTWTFSSDGTLTISGKGEMPNYECLENLDNVSRVSSSPWGIYNDNITNLIIKNGVTSIGDWAFLGCNITSLNIPNSVTNIGEYAFSSHRLSSVTFGNSVKTIGKGAFGGNIISSEIIIYQNTPPKLDGSVFFGATCFTGIKLFVPAGSVEAYRTAAGWDGFLIIGEIGEPSPAIAAGTQMSFMYEMCYFTWILYDDGTAIIKNGHSMPYYNCMKCARPWYEGHQNTITAVIIEEGMANISAHAFYQCSNINSISIPGSVVEISNEAPFAGCRNIVKIINHSTDPQIIGNDVFDDVNKAECVLFVPVGSEEAYRVADGWKDFENIKEIQ